MTTWSGLVPRCAALGVGALVSGLSWGAASSFAAELEATPISVQRAASERLDRRRAARAGQLQTPLPGTPDTARPLLMRIAQAGVQFGAPMMIRVFKAESQLEVWLETDGRYEWFATYPICYWSGSLGPKLREGDKQSPEGFYTITVDQLHHGGRWRRSLDIGYPNLFDRVNGRTGSLILVHGGCDSVGCFAMTDRVNAELYDLVSAALKRGQEHVPVHVFPFRMTDANLAAHGIGAWKDFWGDLKRGYDSFERTRRPPRVSVCAERYKVADGHAGDVPAEVGLCAEDLAKYGTVVAAMRAAKDKRRNGATADAGGEAATRTVPCSLALPSCRRWVALRDRRDANGTVAERRSDWRSRVR